MKVAKEQIVGMVAAVDWLLEQTDEGMEKEFTRRADVISSIVKDVPTLNATIFIPEVANHVPHLILTYDPAKVGITPNEVQQRLRTLDPSIELNPATGSSHAGNGMPACPNALVIGTWMLLPGEPEIVGQKIRAALMKGKA
jgi:L-seryl-tRNA(Ser) seleniumtransferase